MSLGCTGLGQPVDDLSDLGAMALSPHPCTERAQQLAQCGTGPMHTVIRGQHLQDLMLGVLCSPAPEALRQRWRRSPSFYTQTAFQRMQ
jgi:hypothetical protein